MKLKPAKRMSCKTCIYLESYRYTEDGVSMVMGTDFNAWCSRHKEDIVNGNDIRCEDWVEND